MALALNTSHPLYANLIAFICVDDDNTVKDLKGDTCTTDPAVVIGSGAYGRHFRTSVVSNLAKGIALTNGHLTKPVANPVGTMIAIINAGNSKSSRGTVVNSPISFCNSIGVYTGDAAGCQTGNEYPKALGTTDVIGTGQHMIAAAWNGTTEYKTWVDGSQQAVVSGSLGNANDNTTSRANYIGGAPSGGFGGFAADYVYYIFFSKYLTEAELDELYTSLGANNQISLLSAGTPTPISFTGTIPAQTFSAGQAVSVNLATYFSGTETPFTFANTGTSLSSVGLSINSSGVLSGTAVEGSVTGVVVTGTDSATNTAASNAFNITVNAAGTPVSFSGTVPTLSGTQGSAITPLNLSTYFAGSLTPFTYSVQVGALPSGLALNTSTGVISGTPTTTGTTNISVRATDSGSNTADTNTFTVDIAAAPSADGVITLSELKNNTATPLTSLSGFNVTLLTTTNPKSVVYNSGSISTNGSATLTFSNAAINAGTEYVYLIERAGTAFAAGKVTAT